MMRLIQKSLVEQIPIEMIYFSEKNEMTQRLIIVKKIDGNHFYAYCYLRKRTRKLIFSNILAIMPTKKQRAI